MVNVGETKIGIVSIVNCQFVDAFFERSWRGGMPRWTSREIASPCPVAALYPTIIRAHC
jgi:hypothetical protein